MPRKQSSSRNRSYKQRGKATPRTPSYGMGSLGETDTHAMKTQNPRKEDIEELVSFLPYLYADGFSPIKEWKDSLDPAYEDIVLKFFRVAAKDCWCDYKYSVKEASEMIRNEELIKNANISQIKTMLTYCVRGERFCEGHWDAMIREGYIRRLLERLSTILKEIEH